MLIKTLKLKMDSAPVAAELWTKMWTDTDPALSPKMVTFFGFPPNLAMFSWTHSSALTWSLIPQLPGQALSSVLKNPSTPKYNTKISTVPKLILLIDSFKCAKFDLVRPEQENSWSDVKIIYLTYERQSNSNYIFIYWNVTNYFFCFFI